MIDLALHRISRLLSRTPLPWRSIHVAGTNGKGSICAYISSMLDVYNASSWRKHTEGSPIRHGRFTSPHLIDRWDCITIDQKPVQFSVFAEMEQKVLDWNRRESIGATEFELLTATAFEIFTREKIDVGVVEVGLGGRLDATNILGQSVDGPPPGMDVMDFRPPPLVTAISSIGLDHQAFLGNTLEEIAKEKAGIIKPNVPMVYDESNDPGVVEVLRGVANANSSPLVEPPLDSTANDSTSPSHLLRKSVDIIQSKDKIKLSQHTRSNLNVAFLATWTALRHLQRIDLDLKSEAAHAQPDARLQDLAQEMVSVATTTSFPGRQQHLSIEELTGRKEAILLDGAHNAASAVALASEIERLGLRTDTGKTGTITWVIAASDSKDVTEILSPLLKDGDAVFAVEFGPVDGMPWVKPLAASHLLESAKAGVSNAESLDVHDCGSDVLSALRSASHTAAEGPMVVVGSLYLVSDILRLLRDS